MLIAHKQATIDAQGHFVSTPSIKVYQSDNATIKVGKFYRTQHEDLFLGIQIQVGSAGKETILWPVDRSQIPQGFTFEYIKKENNDE